METMFGHKTIFKPYILILCTILFSCAHKKGQTESVEEAIPPIIESEFLNVHAKVDYENIVTKIFLTYEKNIIDSVLIDEAYGAPLIKRKGNVFDAVIPTRGGLGMKREMTYVYEILKNKMTLIFSFTNFEKFSDNMFPMEFYKDSSMYYLENGTYFLKGMMIKGIDTTYYRKPIVRDFRKE